jgi:peptidoglycan hydrolase-like protein with peptidoglycan-binding domain
VEQLQQRLSALGFYSGTIDGIFGEETESAVQDFQAEFDLETDGIVGSATWQTLFNTP